MGNSSFDTTRDTRRTWRRDEVAFGTRLTTIKSQKSLREGSKTDDGQAEQAASKKASRHDNKETGRAKLNGAGQGRRLEARAGRRRSVEGGDCEELGR